MNAKVPTTRPIPLWARALAGVVAVLGIATLAAIVVVVASGRAPPPLALVIGLIAGAPIITLFAFVSIRGTLPPWQWCLTIGWSGRER